MVSSARPKVVPPKAINVVTKIIKMYSFQCVSSRAIPASNTPVAFTTPISPRIIRTNKIISILAYIPFNGAIINSIKP
jgi:hypothetical protein